MVDALSAVACCSSLQSPEFGLKFFTVQELYFPAAHSRYQGQVKLALGVLSKLVEDTMLAELCFRPLTAVIVTEDIAQPELF